MNSERKNPMAVQGQRSPRWAFMKRMVIPCRQGEGGEAVPYLARLRIIQTPIFAIYLHDIYEPDGDSDPHNHPWPFISVILRGEYTEHLYPHPTIVPYKYLEQTWRRWSAHRMERTSAHRIVRCAPGLKTLIITGPRSKDDWGFFTDEGWKHWKEYERKYGTL